MLAALIIPIMNESIFWAITLVLIISLVAGIIPFLIASIHLKLARNKALNFKENVTGEIRNNGIRYFLGSLLMQIYIFLWALLFTIPGMIKQYSYSMTPYIMKDDEAISPNNAITASRKMMDGHKVSLFLLHLRYVLPPFLLYLSSLIIIVIVLSLFPESTFDGGAGVGLVIITGLLFAIAIIASIIIAIRNMPRLNVANALFYEDIRGESHYAVDESLPEWEEEF